VYWVGLGHKVDGLDWIYKIVPTSNSATSLMLEARRAEPEWGSLEGAVTPYPPARGPEGAL